ncbi:MAG TPA: porin family protein [Burkholderiales bacterium]|nr:porin family protein [Burkholderiales bacterium]
MLKRLMIAASLALGASGAYAQEAGWYGGLDVGGSHLSGINTDGLDSFDKSDTGFDVNLGYRLNRNFAVEGAYTDLGKFHFSSAAVGDGDVKPTAVSLSAVGILPLQSNFSLYGKAGVAHTETKALGASDTKDGLLAGAGVMYDFNRNVYAKAGWDHFDDVGNDATGKGHADLYSLGVGYRF